MFSEFGYRTLDSWSRLRRVVAKAEHMAKGANPRFVVTSLSCDRRDAQALYEEDYCARGEMENRIKEQQLYLFADRTSCETMRANQLRLYFSSIAYTLMQTLRRIGLKGTSMATARCDTIRLKLLKLGAQVRVTVRKVWVSFSQAYPYRQLFYKVLANLRRATPLFSHQAMIASRQKPLSPRSTIRTFGHRVRIDSTSCASTGTVPAAPSMSAGRSGAG